MFLRCPRLTKQPKGIPIMKPSWNLHETFMRSSSWNLHGTFMTPSWNLHGVFMKASWRYPVSPWNYIDFPSRGAWQTQLLPEEVLLPFIPQKKKAAAAAAGSDDKSPTAKRTKLVLPDDSDNVAGAQVFARRALVALSQACLTQTYTVFSLLWPAAVSCAPPPL